MKYKDKQIQPNHMNTGKNTIIKTTNTNKSSNLPLLSLLSLLILTNLPVILTQSVSFTQINQCKFQSEEGYSYDLNALRNQYTDYKYDYMKYSYRANFCGPLVSTCNASSTPAALFLRRGVCVGKFTKTWVGIKAEYLDTDIKSNGIRLSFDAGERCISSFATPFTLNYTIKCDPTQVGKLETVRKVTNCNYDFVFSSKHGCSASVAASTGNAKKWLFYLSMLFCIYLTVFTYLNYQHNPEDGVMKALPHRDFWREFAEYAVEGYRVSVEFGKSKVEYYVDKYKESRANY